MAYGFNDDKSKFNLNGVGLNWVELHHYYNSIQLGFDSSRPVGGNNWEDFANKAPGYDIIRLDFEIESLWFDATMASGGSKVGDTHFLLQLGYNGVSANVLSSTIEVLHAVIDQLGSETRFTLPIGTGGLTTFSVLFKPSCMEIHADATGLQDSTQPFYAPDLQVADFLYFRPDFISSNIYDGSFEVTTRMYGLKL